MFSQDNSKSSLSLNQLKQGLITIMEENVSAAISEINARMEYLTNDNSNHQHSDHSIMEEIKITALSPSSSGETCSNASSAMVESDNSSSDFTENVHIDSKEIVNMDNNLIPNSNLVNDLVVLKERNGSLQADVMRLEKEIARLEADRLPELHASQLEVLEKTISQQKQEIERLRESIGQQSETSKKHIAQLKQEYDTKLDRVRC